MTENSADGLRILIGVPYADALAKTRAALQQEGFSVMTEIDFRAKLREKLGVELKPYAILGVCNPALAYRALTVEADVGLLLPCNVIVREQSERQCVVAAIDPLRMIGLAAKAEELKPVADEARIRLSRALETVARTSASR